MLSIQAVRVWLWCVVGLAAVRIGTDKAFMLKLVDWCQTEDHAGVQGSLSLLLVLLHTWYTHTRLMALCLGLPV